MWAKTFAALNYWRLKNQGVDQRFMKNPYDLFNLTRKSHRCYGHDLLSATLLGAEDILGVRASDKSIDISDFDLFRIPNGRIAEMWQQYNIGSWP
jgi:hypothetical protein